MKYAYNHGGVLQAPDREYDIATGTAIKAGTFVKLTENLVVQAAADGEVALLGVAAETHSGAAEALNTRSNGLKIKVLDNPLNVYRSLAPIITATSGSTTTIVATAMAALTDDSLNGGYAKLTYKGASSTNTDPVGTVYRITDWVGSTKTATIPTAGGAVTAGDKFAIFPPFGFALADLATTFDALILTATSASPIRVVGRSESTNEIYTDIKLNQLGSADFVDTIGVQ